MTTTLLREFVRSARREFANQQLTLSMKLGKGVVASIEEYRHMTGVIDGYEKAGEVLLSMYKQADTDPEDMGPGSDHE